MRKKVILIAICLVILLSGIIKITKGKNMKSKEPIPQEVINFIKVDEGGEIIFICNWDKYKVYRVSYPELETGVWGLPQYILYDGEKVRWASDDENDDVMYANNNDF